MLSRLAEVECAPSRDELGSVDPSVVSPRQPHRISFAAPHARANRVSGKSGHGKAEAGEVAASPLTAIRPVSRVSASQREPTVAAMDGTHAERSNAVAAACDLNMCNSPICDVKREQTAFAKPD